MRAVRAPGTFTGDAKSTDSDPRLQCLIMRKHLTLLQNSVNTAAQPLVGGSIGIPVPANYVFQLGASLFQIIVDDREIELLPVRQIADGILVAPFNDCSAVCAAARESSFQFGY